MVIHDFDGTPVDIPDAGEFGAYFVTLTYRRGFNEDDTCRFHMEKGGVACDKQRRKDGDCDKCGWNPRVAHKRSYKIRKMMEMEEEARNAPD